MDFLRKSIAKKSFIAFLVLFIVFSGIEYFAIPLVINKYYGSVDGRLLYLAHLIPIGLFFIAAFISVFILAFYPLGKIFYEMKAYISGRNYRKIFTDRIDEMGVLAHFFNDITRGFEKVKIALAEGKRMSEELSVGNDIQRRILPTVMPMVPGISIFGNTRPASEVGGDSFDIITAGNNTLIYVGDVTGHGIPAALIMVMVNTIIFTYSELYPNGYDIIVNTNRILKQQIEPRRFMTCVLLRWNSQENKMYFTGAGHEHILIFRKKDSFCEVKQTGGIALGMVPDISRIVKEEQIPLEIGDYVVLYSDGIIETKSISGEMFGIDRLKKSVESHAGSSTPEELVAKISKDFSVYVGDQIQEDDITLIAVLRK